MFGLGFGEVVLVLIIALVFIGPKKLPELAKGLGKGLREFQDAAKGFQDQMTKEVDDLKPKLDDHELPKLADIKNDILPIENKASGHGHFDPYPDEPKPEDSSPEKEEKPS